MLICAAGPRPATMRLASITAQGLRSTQDRYRLRQPRITKVSTSPAPAPLIIAIGLIKSRPPLSASTSNPHSAQRSSRIHSRGFFLWRLSDAGPKPPSSAHRPSSAGIRNPSQNRTLAVQTTADTMVYGLRCLHREPRIHQRGQAIDSSSASRGQKPLTRSRGSHLK
jgi:hypothetical protein